MEMLAFGAHPDDCELFAGGTLARLSRAGRCVGIVDLTRGEMASRGSPEERAEEMREASKVLGIASRKTLDLGDTRLEVSRDNCLQIVRILRTERPGVVLTHYLRDRHPDHERAYRLVREACFLSDVAGVDTGQERHGVAALYCFPGNMTRMDVTPSFVVDVSDVFEQKLEAIRAYRSQFHNPDYSGEPTYISSEAYFDLIRARARVYGDLIGVTFGEAFWSERPLRPEDLAIFV